MAHVYVTPNNKMKRAAMLLLPVAMVAGAWWVARHDQTQGARMPQDAPAAAVVKAPAAPTVTPTPIGLPGLPEGPKTMAEAKAQAQVVIAQREEAAREVERSPQLKPLVGPVHERPAFVSDMEWQALKLVAAQSAEQDKTLTRLVNDLRFMKQLEQWRNTAGQQTAERQPLAAQLLEDLPERVRLGGLGIDEARPLQNALLAQAYPDAKERRKRAGAESRRLDAAAQEAAREAARQGLAESQQVVPQADARLAAAAETR